MSDNGPGNGYTFTGGNTVTITDGGYYTLTRLTSHFSVAIPCGTLLSNVIAGLFVGFIIGLEQQSVTISPKMKLFLTTGLLGGLSTFSTFSIETVSLFQDGKLLASTGNVALNLVLSLTAVVMGMLIAKTICKNGGTV